MSASERFQTHVAVFVIIRNDAGEILLQKRQNTSYLDGYWDFPSGHV
ncbi:MAG: NUDIX domain-containing protein, partial [Candidatus Saccharimonadales bacterium]